ncbi:hypothetical protein YC2023_033380 [Brassica napus]
MNESEANWSRKRLMHLRKHSFAVHLWNRESKKLTIEEGSIIHRLIATRGLPRRSPILVLLSPKHAKPRGSDGIQCISAGVIAPVTNPNVRPWGPHDFQAVLFPTKKRVETEFEPEKLRRLFNAHYGFWGFPKWCYGRRSSSRLKIYEVSKFRLVLG